LSLFVICPASFFWAAGATSAILLRKETKANIEPKYWDGSKLELENGIGFLPAVSYLQTDVAHTHEIMQHAGKNAEKYMQSKMAIARADGQQQHMWPGRRRKGDSDSDGDGKENALDKLKKILGCKVGLMFSDQVQAASEALQNLTRSFEQVAETSEGFAEHARSLQTKAEEFVEKAKAKSLEDNTTDAMQKVIDLATQAANKTASTAKAAGEAAESMQKAVEKANNLAKEFAKNATEAIQKAMDMCPKLPEAKALWMESRARSAGKFIPGIADKLKKAACNVAKVVATVAKKVSAGFVKAAGMAQNISEKADEKASLAGQYADKALEAAEVLEVHAAGDLSEKAAKMFLKATEAANKAAGVLQGLQMAAMTVSQTAEAVEIAAGPVQQNTEKLVEAAETLCADADTDLGDS